jgi:uncharacterized membrane protein YoaK (UPF0700 family)
VLTFNTGLIDAVSYIGLGRVFVTNMTGNVVLLAFAAAEVSGLSVMAALLSARQSAESSALAWRPAIGAG